MERQNWVGPAKRWESLEVRPLKSKSTAKLDAVLDRVSHWGPQCATCSAHPPGSEVAKAIEHWVKRRRDKSRRTIRASEFCTQWLVPALGYELQPSTFRRHVKRCLKAEDVLK